MSHSQHARAYSQTGPKQTQVSAKTDPALQEALLAPGAESYFATYHPSSPAAMSTAELIPVGRSRSPTIGMAAMDFKVVDSLVILSSLAWRSPRTQWELVSVSGHSGLLCEASSLVEARTSLTALSVLVFVAKT